MTWNKRLVRYTCLLSMALTLVACKISMGLAPISSIDYNRIKTMQIVDFQNHADYVADRRVLFYLIEGELFAMKPVRGMKPVATVMEEEPSVDRTLSLINAFLAAKPEEEVEDHDLELAADYASGYVLTEDNISEEEEKPQESEIVEEKVQEELDDGYFTETLARIYIKQHRFDKALEFFRKFYLKYPQNNIYFADQIRFLEKLVINEKSKL